jgi:hypothetical protein
MCKENLITTLLVVLGTILTISVYYEEYHKNEIDVQKEEILNQEIKKLQFKIQQLEESTKCKKDSTQHFL